MTNKRGAWIGRRGQVDAAQAIDQVIDRQPQPNEQVQRLADAHIEDSPYQARGSFDARSVEDLAQGMRETGFQGVLVTRPHSDPAKRRRGMVQLVYGHRRRVAWRLVCAERAVLCELPVVVRDITDEQLLTIGAQENLQRQDLDPVEEAQIVAWHEKMYFAKNQAEIGAMLGKSVDWVKVRSRVHKLPDALKERLHARPRAMSQMLEIAPLYIQQPERALDLADEVVQEQLTLDQVRTAIRQYERPSTAPLHREEIHNQSGATPLVQEITNDIPEEGVVLPRSQRTDDTTDTPRQQRVSAPGGMLDEQHTQPGVSPRRSVPAQTPDWVVTLCDQLAHTTQALQIQREHIARLAPHDAVAIQNHIEALLAELMVTTQALAKNE